MHTISTFGAYAFQPHTPRLPLCDAHLLLYIGVSLHQPATTRAHLANQQRDITNTADTPQQIAIEKSNITSTADTHHNTIQQQQQDCHCEKRDITLHHNTDREKALHKM